MTQPLNDATEVAATASDAKPAWTSPVIESYDVAKFTLSSRGSNPGDGAANHS